MLCIQLLFSIPTWYVSDENTIKESCMLFLDFQKILRTNQPHNIKAELNYWIGVKWFMRFVAMSTTNEERKKKRIRKTVGCTSISTPKNFRHLSKIWFYISTLHQLNKWNVRYERYSHIDMTMKLSLANT